MKALLPFLAVALLARAALGAEPAAPTLSQTDSGIKESLAEAKKKSLDPEISRLLAQVRDISAAVKVRIDAMRKLEAMIAAAGPLDQGSIADALVQQARSPVPEIRQTAILLAGQAAEDATQKVEEENAWTRSETPNEPAYRVPDLIAQGLAAEIRSNSPASHAADGGVRSDLLIAYSRAGARVRSGAGLMGRDVDDFLKAVADDIRTGVAVEGDPAKGRAAYALDHFLTSYAPQGHRLIPGAGPQLARNRPEVLRRIVDDLWQIAGAPSGNSLAPRRNPNSTNQPADPDHNFRFNIVHALLYLRSATGDRRIDLLLTRMQEDELHPALKQMIRAQVRTR